VKLRWRVSGGARRSLGWIPFKASALQYRAGQVHLAGVPLSLWDSYGLSRYELGGGSISEDARGRWYLNVTVKSPGWPKSRDLEQVQGDAVGIDPGLKDLMVASDGEQVAAQQFYRDLEPRAGRGPARGQQAQDQGDSRKNRQPQERPPAQTLNAPGGHPPGHLRGRRQRPSAHPDQDGQVRPGRWVEHVSNHAAVQVR